MVDIVTQSPGLSAEEIERYITIPIETQVAGIKNLRTIRTISLYGLSDVKLQFSFDYTYDEALQQVLNRLAQLAPLPGNVQPPISPLSPIGEIFRYRLVGPPNYSVLDLKTLQDWVLQRRFRAVPGVIDVTGWGGKTKTYELQVDFNKLVAIRPDAAAAAAGGQQCQHQCRRQHRQYRRAIRRGARRRPDPLDRRPRQHHGVAKRRQSGAGQGHRDRDGRREAAARHRRHRPGRRHRAGHRADAPRRAELADHRARRAAGQPASTTPASCRRACGSSASTTART